MFCSEGIFGALLLPANEISLLKRSLILGRVGSLTWLIGPRSRPGGFCANKEIFFSRVANSGIWAADTVECPLRSCKYSVGKNGPKIGGICFSPVKSSFSCVTVKPPAFQPHPHPLACAWTGPRARGGLGFRLVGQTPP